MENNRKIIEYTTLHVQTKTFDTLLDGISQQIAQCGGYVESSEIAGNDYRSSGNRYATLVVRVPSETSSEFSSYVSDNSTVTHREIRTAVSYTHLDVYKRQLYSFTSWRGTYFSGGGLWESFVGLQNYQAAFQNQKFLDAFWYTIKFTVIAVISINVTALALALMEPKFQDSRVFSAPFSFCPTCWAGWP